MFKKYLTLVILFLFPFLLLAQAVCTTDELGNEVCTMPSENIIKALPEKRVQHEIFSKLKQFSVIETIGGFQDANAFLKFLDASKIKTTESPSTHFWAWLGLIFLGGIALNLTPCVLPMIPINIGFITGATLSDPKRNRWKGFFLASSYGLGMMLAYGGLGLLFILAGVRFGTLNASPTFNFSIAGLFFILAFAMAEIGFRIDFSRFSNFKFLNRLPQAQMMSVFVLGMIAAILSGACVAPVLISVLFFSADAYANGDFFALTYPFLLGLGMALPWAFMGAGLTVLPKPGKWMVYIKQAFALIILIAALGYAYEGYRLLNNQTSNIIPEVSQNQQLIQALDESIRTQKEVVIFFTASWCVYCEKMKNTTLVAPEIKDALTHKIFFTYHAEDPDHLEVSPILSYFNIAGFPGFVMLKPIPKASAEAQDHQ